MISIPVVDANTMALVTWRNGRSMWLDIHSVNTDTYPINVGWNHIAITETNHNYCMLYLNGVKTGKTIGPVNCGNLMWIERKVDAESIGMSGAGQRLGMICFSDCVRYTSNFDPNKLFSMAVGGAVR